MTSLEKKETQAIDLIRAASKQHSYVVSYSGGKDSEVVLHLFRKAKVPYTIVYRSTTIDHPGTISHVLSRGATILRPKVSFFTLIQKKGLPSFARRFCCERIKEGYIAPAIALGIRAGESTKRAKRYHEPEVCRVYSKSKRTTQLLPILTWSLQDVHDYILAEEIQCHRLYYDDSGTFHPERRLGCLGCPLPWDRSIKDFERYPRLVKAWCHHLRIFRYNHPESIAIRLFRNEYEQFAHNLFYHDYNKFYEATFSLFPLNWKYELEQRFCIKFDTI